MNSVLIPIEAIASINDILRPFNLEILQSNSGESIELVGTLVNVDNFQHFSGSVPPIYPSLFIEPLLSRLKLLLFEMCPRLSSTKFDSVSCILTGQDGYDGGFMIEYETSAAAGGYNIYWPDQRKFTEEHVAYWKTFSHPGAILHHTIGNILTDLSHEVCHVVQTAMHHTIVPGVDDGWLAEHDPSACSLILLKHALTVNKICDNNDGYALPGLFETTLLYATLNVLSMQQYMSAEALDGYKKWRNSFGYENPMIDSAPRQSSYAKDRLALDSYGPDLYHHLSLLLNRTGDIRAQQDVLIASGYALPDPKSSFARELLPLVGILDDYDIAAELDYNALIL